MNASQEAHRLANERARLEMGLMIFERCRTLNTRALESTYRQLIERRKEQLAHLSQSSARAQAMQ